MKKASYVTCLKEYPNGEKQLRVYEHAVLCNESSESKKYTVPFDPWVAEDISKCPTPEEYLIRKETSRQRNAVTNHKRTKRNLLDKLKCANWEYFITLTFDPKKVDRYNYEECRRRATTYLNNIKKRYCSNLQYILVPEQHKDGAYHFHAVIANCNNLPLTFSGKYDKKHQEIYNLSWSYGFSTATKVVSRTKTIRYITKYITKQLNECLFGKRKYSCSQNLEHVVCTTFSYPFEFEDIIMLLNSFGVDEFSHFNCFGDKSCYNSFYQIEFCC